MDKFESKEVLSSTKLNLLIDELDSKLTSDSTLTVNGISDTLVNWLDYFYNSINILQSNYNTLLNSYTELSNSVSSYHSNHNITIVDTSYGVITTSRLVSIAGNEIEIYVTPSNGYGIDIVSVYETGNKSNLVTVLGDYKFTMPDYDVTIEVAFATIKIESISIKTNPTKLEYTNGETFDPTGLVITATNNAGSLQDISYAGNYGDFAFDKSILTSEDNSVTITYGGKSTIIYITVSEPEEVVTKIIYNY